MKKLRRRNKTMSTKMTKKKHRKEGRVEDGLNTNLTPIAWTRLNIPFLQLKKKREEEKKNDDN